MVWRAGLTAASVRRDVVLSRIARGGDLLLRGLAASDRRADPLALLFLLLP